MKIVHTFWSCNITDIESLIQHKAGWRNAQAHYMAWALSCSLARRLYDEVELVTDKLGKELLIDTFKLPYTAVHTILDEPMSKMPANLWAFPKILSYDYQTEPFLHIDGDVFLFKKLNKSLENCRIASQNIEIDFPIYKEAMVDIERRFSFIPEEIKQDRVDNEFIMAANTGLFGGNDLNFIKKYTQKAIQFINSNTDYLASAHPVYFNCVFEQYLLYCLSRKERVRFSYVIDRVASFEEYFPIARFFGKATQFGYVHPVGPFKKHPRGCRGVASMLRKEFPEAYRSIHNAYNKPFAFKHFLFHLNSFL